VSGSFTYNPKSQQSIINLFIDHLPLNNYIPSKTQGEKKSIHLRGTKVRANLTTSGSISNWRGTGNASVRGFNAGDFKANSITINSSMRNGIMTLSPITANLYKGTYRGSAQLDLTKNAPSLSGNHTIRNVDTNQLLNDVKALTKLELNGTGNGEARLSFTLGNKETFYKSLNGDMNLRISNGVLDGIDIAYYMDVASRLYGKLPLTSVKNTKRTPFDSVTATVNLTNGVAKNKDFLLTSPEIRVEGHGKADLVKRWLNYSLVANRTRGVLASPLTLDNIPIKIIGPFDKLVIGPDVEAILKRKVLDTIKGKDVTEPLKKLIPEEIIPKDLDLKKLF